MSLIAPHRASSRRIALRRSRSRGVGPSLSSRSRPSSRRLVVNCRDLLRLSARLKAARLGKTCGGGGGGRASAGVAPPSRGPAPGSVLVATCCALLRLVETCRALLREPCAAPQLPGAAAALLPQPPAEGQLRSGICLVQAAPYRTDLAS